MSVQKSDQLMLEIFIKFTPDGQPVSVIQMQAGLFDLPHVLQVDNVTVMTAGKSFSWKNFFHIAERGWEVNLSVPLKNFNTVIFSRLHVYDVR